MIIISIHDCDDNRPVVQRDKPDVTYYEDLGNDDCEGMGKKQLSETNNVVSCQVKG